MITKLLKGIKGHPHPTTLLSLTLGIYEKLTLLDALKIQRLEVFHIKFKLNILFLISNGLNGVTINSLT